MPSCTALTAFAGAVLAQHQKLLSFDIGRLRVHSSIVRHVRDAMDGRQLEVAFNVLPGRSLHGSQRLEEQRALACQRRLHHQGRNLTPHADSGAGPTAPACVAAAMGGAGTGQ